MLVFVVVTCLALDAAAPQRWMFKKYGGRQ
jgi:hypothetical protein